MNTLEELQIEYSIKETTIPITQEMHDNDIPVICPYCYEKRALEE